MRHFAIALCLLLTTSAIRIFATPAQVIIIPHAEVDSSGHLTQQGLERAGALAGYIIFTPNLTIYGEPVAIFAARPTPTRPKPPFYKTDKTQACIQTVAPTAQSLTLPIHSGYSKLEDSKIASFILNNKKYAGKNVLICWRNGKIQKLAAAFGVSSPPAFPLNVFNLTWVITFSPNPTLQILPQDLLFSDN